MSDTTADAKPPAAEGGEGDGSLSAVSPAFLPRFPASTNSVLDALTASFT
jgi:hypothetical protein